MKLKSLLLGSAAALALTSGALAADPRASIVSLDVCDAYGITGLTIASDDTCLKISGSVSYEFIWGDYRDSLPWAGAAAGNRNIELPNTAATGRNDWRSRLEAILSFEATTQTDAGAAKAHITLRERNYFRYQNNVLDQDGDEHGLRVQDAWVSFGDTTVLMAGKKGSIAKLGNDEPFNYLGLANSQSVDTGVLWSYDKRDVPNHLRTGGHVIQIVSEVADGISVGLGLESLDGAPGIDDGVANALGNSAGSLVGFVEAKGSWGQAHLTAVLGNILTDHPDALRPWGIHTGATLNFDNFKVRGALATDNTGYWNALISGEAAFDMFTLAASAEFINTGNTVVNVGDANANPVVPYAPANALIGTNTSQMGLGVSAGFQATETIKINAGFRYFDNDTASPDNEGWQAALQVVASLTDTITATGAVGVYGGPNVSNAIVGDFVSYIDVGVAYKPGGGFETGAGMEFNSEGTYKLKFNAKKTF